MMALDFKPKACWVEAAVGRSSSVFPTQRVAVPSTASDIAAAYPNAGAALAKRIVEVAKRLGIPDPGWLANLMNFETGGSFDPGIRNRSSGATGLIQFMPKTAAGMGTTTDALARMSQLEQMDWVERYLERKTDRGMSEPTDVYMAVFFPVAMGKGADFSIYDWYVRNRGQGAADGYLRQNAGIETAGDYTDHANRRAKLPTGMHGVEVLDTGVRVLPWILAGSSVVLLFALYVRFREPQWAGALTQRRE
jgi:hypothetical protein